ncbi:MAG: sensor domain-containing diguanylate cyclase [Candidatus Coatesbacteria bacterium]|nr:sensor domain-containing diguanylate cyclase [Candidatus Coatesbacteria bacterium]
MEIIAIPLAVIFAIVAVIFYFKASSAKKEKDDLSSKLNEVNFEFNRLKGEHKHLDEIYGKAEEAQKVLDDILSSFPESCKRLIEEQSNSEKSEVLISLLRRLFDAPNEIKIYIADRQAEKLALIKTSNADEKLDQIYDVEKGYIGWAIRKRNPVSDSDLENESNLVRQELEKADDKQFAYGVSLRYEDRLLGLLTIGMVRKRRPYDKKILGLIARITSVALINTELIKQIKNPNDIDEVTKLYNEGYLMRRIEDEINRCQRFKTKFSILAFEIDDFEDYSSKFGENAATQLLKNFASLFPSFFRTTDIIASVKRNLFVILLTGTTEQDVAKFRDNLRTTIKEFPYPHQYEWKKDLSISGGVTEYPKDGEGVQMLVEAAEELVLSARFKGKDRVLFVEEANQL